MYNFNILQQLKPEEILTYLRKSISDDPMLSVEEVLEKHETILNEWFVRNYGVEISEESKYRELCSGETIADRPEVQKVLKLIESPKIKAILVVEVQRLSRGDLEDAGRLIKLLRYTDTLVITPQKVYDLKDEYDRDAFERELKRGNEFLEYQKKIMGRGRLLSVSQGNYIGSVPPYGFDRVWVMDGNRKCPTLAENKEQADVVRMIFDLYVNKDMGYQRISNTLAQMNIKPPADAEYWSVKTIHGTLSNVHYIGKVRWNMRKVVTVVEDSEIRKIRPQAQDGEYLIYDGKHEGIISEELYNAAQEKKGRNNRTPASKTLRNAFASILYCNCGRAMSLHFNKKKDGSERNAPRLTCTAQHRCKTTSCSYPELMDMVGDILEQRIQEFEIKSNRHEDDSVQLHQKIINNLEKKLKDIQAKELSQWEAQSDPNPENRMPQEIFKQLNAKLLKEKEEVQIALNKAYETMPEPINYEEMIIKFKDALSALRNPDADAGEKNKLLKECIERIEYYRKPNGRKQNTPIEINVKLKV